MKAKPAKITVPGSRAEAEEAVRLNEKRLPFTDNLRSKVNSKFYPK